MQCWTLTRTALVYTFTQIRPLPSGVPCRAAWHSTTMTAATIAIASATPAMRIIQFTASVLIRGIDAPDILITSSPGYLWWSFMYRRAILGLTHFGDI